MPQTNDDSPRPVAADKAPRRRKAARAVLGLCLVGVTILAAWKAHERWFRADDGPSTSRPQLRDRGFAAGEQAQWATTSPYEMTGRPLLAAGMQPLDGQPGGIAPPSGAEPRLSFQRKAADTIIKHASYTYGGDKNVAAEHYLRAIEAAEFEVLSDSTKGPTTRLIVARRGKIRLIVLLRTGKAPEHMVEISVTSIGAAGRGG